MNKVTRFISFRPLSLLAIVGCLHSIAHGLGLALGLEEFKQTLMYKNVGDIMSQSAFGWILVAAGLAGILAIARWNDKWIGHTSTIQAIIWLFAGLLYVFNGTILLAISVGLSWAIIAGYSGWAIQNRDEWSRLTRD